jgi:tetratricopeptide (TPR) repeat protein
MLHMWMAVAVLPLICFAVSLRGQSSPQAATGAGPGEFPALAAKAAAARKGERVDESAALYRKALRLNPRWTEGWWWLGTIDYDADRYAEAALELGKVVTLDPKQGTARAMLGLCQFRLGEDAKALANIETARVQGIAEDADLRRVVTYHEGVLLQRAGRFEGAMEALDALCQSGAAGEDVQRVLGMAALRMRDSVAPAPGTEAAGVVMHIGRGACLAAHKNYDAARREYALVEQHAPHFPWFHYAYGRLLEESRDPAAAIEQYKQEIVEQPRSVIPRLRIGAAQYKRDSAAGLPYVQQALDIAPDLPFAHYLLGLLLLDTGDYAASIRHLEIARRAFPAQARIALSLGAAYAHAGRPEDAARERKEFQQLSQTEKQASSQGEASPHEAAQIVIKDSMLPQNQP